MGRLPIIQCLASARLSFLCEHGLDSSLLKALPHMADRLVRDVESHNDVLVAPSFIALEQDTSAG
jgi:hypothetical protein